MRCDDIVANASLDVVSHCHFVLTL